MWHLTGFPFKLEDKLCHQFSSRRCYKAENCFKNPDWAIMTQTWKLVTGTPSFGDHWYHWNYTKNVRIKVAKYAEKNGKLAKLAYKCLSHKRWEYPMWSSKSNLTKHFRT